MVHLLHRLYGVDAPGRLYLEHGQRDRQTNAQRQLKAVADVSKEDCIKLGLLSVENDNKSRQNIGQPVRVAVSKHCVEEINKTKLSIRSALCC